VALQEMEVPVAMAVMAEELEAIALAATRVARANLVQMANTATMALRADHQATISSNTPIKINKPFNL
jgi:hypothetical protein